MGDKLQSISARMGAAVGFVLLGLLAVFVTGWLGLRQLERHIDHLVSADTVKSEAASQMRLGIVSRVDAVRNIALKSNIDAMQVDQQRIDQVLKIYATERDKLKALELSDAERDALAKADEAEAKAAPLLKQAQGLARTMQPEMAAEILTTKLAPVQAQWTAALDELTAATQAARSAVLADTQAARQRTLTGMGVAAVLALCGGVAFALLLGRGISRRLAVAVQVTQRIAAGDLTGAQRDPGRDEVAQTINALADMQDRLRATLEEVRSAAQAIETASSEIASGTNDLSARTEQSAGSLQQTAASMEQLTGTVRSSAENAGVAHRLADDASQVARQGGDLVGQVVSTMEDISTSSRRIGDIIGVIDGIAFQTNILALNAAVEAARAGEQGRGFAVVASEVRALAQRSAEAAREIKTLVGSSVDKVESGSQLVSQAGKTMQDIVSSVKRVSDVIGEIAQGAAEQTSGISEIGGAVQQLDQMTQQNAALVEQSAAAAKSLHDQTTRLAHAVGSFRLSTV